MTLQHKRKAVQAATNMSWSWWTQKYLLVQTERKTWSSLNANFKKVDLVLLCDKNLKRSHWPLGSIVETLPGPDNVVRVIKVQTKDSSYVKSVASLALLKCSCWCSLMCLHSVSFLTGVGMFCDLCLEALINP